MGKAQSTQARAVAPSSELRTQQGNEPVVAHASGRSLSEILKLKADLAAVRVQVAVIKHEIAIRRARGLPPLMESDAGWQRFLAAFERFGEACRKAGFHPDQQRVPAGSPDGGQWTTGDAGAGRNDPRLLSDATSDNDWKPGARYAQNRGGGGSRLIYGRWVQPTPAQAARLAVMEARAQEAIQRVRNVDPEWKPPPSIYESVEGLIRAREAEAEHAQARFLELQRHGIGAGLFAVEWMPARGPMRTYTKDEIERNNQNGATWGCHTCGTKDSGTRSGNFIRDHQLPNAWNVFEWPQRIYPHCATCSARQGYWLSRNLRRR